MIAKLHKKGQSFAGAAAYLLHDKDAKTNERVAWTKTRNLATDNPQSAWKVMAATAMDQARLKREAGIKNTGRKSKAHVLHLTLSWHPDESVTRAEMLRAADGALQALGASEHQALFVAHSDEPQAHLHLLLNRVSWRDGRLLSSSKEKLALSKWAESYERDRGEIRCAQRVANNAARRRKEFTRAAKEKPRHVFELEAANGNEPSAKDIREAQRQKDLAVRRKELEFGSRKEKEWFQLQERCRIGKAKVVVAAKRKRAAAKTKLAASLLERWESLQRDQHEARARFVKREKTGLGRAANALKQIDWPSLLRHERRGKAIVAAFRLLSSSTARADRFRQEQQRETLVLEGKQLAAERKVARPIRAALKEELREVQGRFLAGRSALVLDHEKQQAALRVSWRKRGKERRWAWERFRAGREAAAQAKDPERKRKVLAREFMASMRKVLEEREAELSRDLDPKSRGPELGR